MKKETRKELVIWLVWYPLGLAGFILAYWYAYGF